MRILLLCAAPTDSGCWLKTKYLGKSLDKAGHKVFYIKPVYSKPLMMDYILSLGKYVFLSLFIKCDVIIGIKAYPNVTIPMLMKKFTGAITVLDLDDLDYAYREGLISKVSKAVQAPFPRIFDLVTYHNDNLKKHAISDFKVEENKLYRLDQGVDFDVFDYLLEVDKKLLLDKYKIRDSKLIVYTAHLNIASDLDAILEAFSLVTKKVNNVKLLIVGGGPMLQYFRELAERFGVQDNVIFTGYVSSDEVARISKIADLCIVFYKNKKANFFRTSMKIRENLAMGKNVVCNDVGDLKEFKNYTYQTLTDIPVFSSEIVNVLGGKLDDRAFFAVDYIRSKYSWEDIGRNFSVKLQELV